jgi:hypothetical protein
VPVGSDESLYGILRGVGAALPVQRFNQDGVNFLIDGNLNTFTVNGLAIFSDWTAGNPLAPTAAPVSITGRVFDSTGRAISKARVILTDQDGTILSAITNAFGYYNFDGVVAGRSYVASITSKGYTFAPRLISVTDDLTDLNFFAQP